MKKNLIFAMAAMTFLCACNDKPKQQNESASETPKTENTTENATNAEESADVPPVVASCVNGLPLFAPFNEGDLLDEGRALKQSPEKYTKFIMKDIVLDVTYKEEKNKNLEHDDSYLNQYVYKSKDLMKGQIYNYADAKAVEQYMKKLGTTTAEGDFIPCEYDEGILVSTDYLQGRSVLNFHATATEDPDRPEFPAAVVAKVEKLLGMKIEKNRISSIFGNKDEYNFGVMKTKHNDKYAIAAWVLAKDNDVSIFTDTCEVVTEEGEPRVYWSNYDPDEYMEPNIVTVVKGEKGLDIYTQHMDTDEMSNYYLMRQEGTEMKRIRLGGFYQMYE